MIQVRPLQQSSGSHDPGQTSLTILWQPWPRSDFTNNPLAAMTHGLDLSNNPLAAMTQVRPLQQSSGSHDPGQYLLL